MVVVNHTAAALVLRAGDQPRLEKLVRSRTTGAGLAARARVVLLASDGVPNYEIAELVGMSRPTVKRWRSRYAERGIGGLANEKRPSSSFHLKTVAACWSRVEARQPVEVHEERLHVARRDVERLSDYSAKHTQNYVYTTGAFTGDTRTSPEDEPRSAAHSPGRPSGGEDRRRLRIGWGTSRRRERLRCFADEPAMSAWDVEPPTGRRAVHRGAADGRKVGHRPGW